MNDEICLHYSKTRKLKNWLREAVTKPYNVIVILALVLLTYLILVPMYEMIKTTFLVSQADLRQIRGAEVGAVTLYHWKRVLFSNLSKSLLYVPLRNSLMIGMSVSVISIIFGATLAWLMVRTDLPWKKALSLIVIIPYMLPSWCKSLAWLTVFKNERIGGSQGFLNAIGITVPDWLAYGPIAIILVLSLHYYAYSYLLVSAALRSINSELEEMGEIVGASKAKILRKITFPLILPAVLSSFILTFSKSIGTFGVPAFLGMKINYYTAKANEHRLCDELDFNFDCGNHRVYKSIGYRVAKIVCDHRRKRRPPYTDNARKIKISDFNCATAFYRSGRFFAACDFAAANFYAARR